MATDLKKIVIVISHSPYGSSIARAGLDAALATAVFDQSIELLFTGEGVFNLLPEQHSEALGVKNIGKLLGSLPLYDIETVHADGESLRRFGLDERRLVVPVLALDRTQVHALLDAADHLVSF